MFEIKIFQDVSKINAKGTAPLSLICRVDKRTVKTPTGISVRPEHFSYEHQTLARKTPDYKLITDRLADLSAQMKNALVQAQKAGRALTDAELRKFIAEKSHVTTEQARRDESDARIVPFFDVFYKVSARRRKVSYLKTFAQVQFHLKTFNPVLTWEMLTEREIDAYVDYLIDVELSNATIHNHIKNLKVLAGEARKEGRIVPTAIDNYRYATERSRPISLSKEELARLVALSPSPGSAPWKSWIRWLFRCYTSLRISECNGLTSKNFYHENGELVLRYTSHKTKKENILPVSESARWILEQCGYRIPTQSRQGEGNYIKELCKQAGINSLIVKVSHSGTKRSEETVQKFQLISSHTARRTFGKRFIEEGGSLFDLQVIYQHDNLKTTAEYIDIQIADLLRTSKGFMDRI